MTRSRQLNNSASAHPYGRHIAQCRCMGKSGAPAWCRRRVLAEAPQSCVQDPVWPAYFHPYPRRAHSLRHCGGVMTGHSVQLGEHDIAVATIGMERDMPPDLRNLEVCADRVSVTAGAALSVIGTRWAASNTACPI